MFFTLIFGDNFFIIDLVNYVRDESCREILAPTSPSGSNIIDAAILCIDVLFEHFMQSANKLSQMCQSKSYIAFRFNKTMDYIGNCT